MPSTIPMNQSTISAMEFIVAILLTMTALAYTFWSMTGWPDAYTLVPSSDTVFIEETNIPEEVAWTGSQIVAKLYQLSGEERIPIVVGNLTFMNEEDVRLQQSYVSLSNLYLCETKFDADGKVERLIFKKKGV